MEEIWKDIKGYENLYQVSNLGRVKSLKRIIKTKNGRNFVVKERLLIPCNLKDGYLGIGLHKNGNSKTLSIHRLVMISFTKNINNKETINHKDGNKHNNNLNNLEWATWKENNIHARKNGLNTVNNRKKVLQLDLNGNFIKEWESLSLASKETNAQLSKICNCCKGKRKTAGGYKWEYALQ